MMNLDRATATSGIAVSLILVLLALLASTTAAGSAPTAVTVGARVAAVAADSLTVLWRLDLADGWHVYGPFRNDTGFPPQIALDLPEGWTADAPRWPVPERYVTAGEILDHVYHHELVLPQVLRRSGDAGPGGNAPREITARVSWLACNQICIPGDTTLTIAVTDHAEPEAARALESALAALPRPLAANAATVAHTPDAVEIHAPQATGIVAIAGETGPFLVDLLHDGQVAGDRLRLRLRPGTGTPGPLELLLIIDHDRNRRTTGSIVIERAAEPGTENRP